MTGKQKFIGSVFLVCTLLFGGCNSRGGFFGKTGKAERPQTGEIARTPTEEEKARLFKQIDRKFENPDAHFRLGQLYQADGLWSQAEYEYNRTLSSDPAHRKAQAAVVKVLLDSGNTAKAELSAEIYMDQVCASAEESLRLGLAFQKQELDEYALSCYRQALHLAPNSAKINRQIGYYYLSKGNKEQGKDYLIRSYQLNPNQPEVSFQLGLLGVTARRPPKTEADTKKLDKIVEQSTNKEAKP